MKKNKHKEVVKGVSYWDLLRCVSGSGLNVIPNWTGIKVASGIKTGQTIVNRKKDPETFTLKEIHEFCKNCNVNSYDIIACFFYDYLDDVDEKEFYANLFRQMSEWISPSVKSDRHDILNAIDRLSEQIEQLRQEINKE